MGNVHYFQANYDQCEACWTEGIRILRVMGDVRGEAMISGNLGALILDRGDLERARELLTRTLILQRQLGDKRSMAFTLTNLGEVWYRYDDSVTARGFYAEALALFREFGDSRSEAIVLTSVARVAWANGECAEAASMLAASTLTLTAIGDASSVVENIELLANVAVRCRAFPEAAELFGAAESIRRAINAPVRASLHTENEQGHSAARAALGPVAFEAARGAGQQLDVQSAAGRVATIARRLVARAKSLPPTAGDVLSDPHHLTERERDVLRLLLAGQSTREIAATLYISPRTASTHVTNILSKLGVTSRAAAVAHALRSGIV